MDGLLSFFVDFFSQTIKKKTTMHNFFFPSFRLMNSELLILRLSSRVSAAMIILLTHSTNEMNMKKKTVGRWEWVWPVHRYYMKR